MDYTSLMDRDKIIFIRIGLMLMMKEYGVGDIHRSPNLLINHNYSQKNRERRVFTSDNTYYPDMLFSNDERNRCLFEFYLNSHTVLHRVNGPAFSFLEKE